MAPRRPGSNSRRREWHALVEHYTPNGTLGRWLLGAPTGMVGLWLLPVALFAVPSVLIPALLGASVAMLLFAVLMLWPIYLSLIGNVESTDAYAKSVTGESKSTGATSVSGSTTGHTSPPTGTTAGGTRSRSTRDPTHSESNSSDPFEELKRQYTAGEISEEEFERRVEAQLGDDTEASTDRASDGDTELTDRR
ncbi:DUF2078 family protein [Natrialba magadii ATCC 43099]|uniref:DUF2078 family protein n=1 Tax=Natrialba magadii (strain ATCC 43099 / DSM 3394 / CCM 3739 / CIP 104546 / IAM 13178 / JCM 8861 / NBRC 102185 / NCIMB 2190 / MS3) TaxID=547559 RepID=D3SV80_NATMM|nr:SHOCT domain-containing protein [Natrialba magadii]ADD05488.1 DUF2078 family protein [Natrialba magadii ATCC 43099]ELY29550.1 hypothetical protein C500_10813 [Natrialba magadii ATCC 43099]